MRLHLQNRGTHFQLKSEFLTHKGQFMTCAWAGLLAQLLTWRHAFRSHNITAQEAVPSKRCRNLWLLRAQASLNCDLLFFYYYHESNVETDATTGTAEISEFVIKHPTLPTLWCTDVYLWFKKMAFCCTVYIHQNMTPKQHTYDQLC